ncbi:bifunctional UDP-N-acetylmuramoyl-tripeptide:D-alanyl-D-alanine ligase/alanine racemase [Thermonema rossianum]|uniref:bifunctional UDP-N-acetylmuramoyl-tripeptide:D-alanyl-D-alanine ligase/alanine racemase n=1 Tax=Thermonema rossianum TaxID=55505 RepID=UPI0012F8AFC7|nr:bifunctional UDP-N-acetylmuramoyl-tripeptide:D-alanyl-D-alanine ligase/alanine racemase [Thermonema rossianum]
MNTLTGKNHAMIEWTSAEVHKVFEPLLVSPAKLGLPGAAVQQLLTDTRSIQKAANTVFFAIPGKHYDGHRFIPEAYAKGVRHFVVQKEWTYDYADVNVWQVRDTVAALQALAAAHRSRFAIPVVGITGSNGKTIVKEWLFALLAQEYSIVRSPKSFNSQIGVPLSVWQMQPYHQLALFEAGISQSGEMERLAAVIRPTIGILTNLGAAHDRGFPNRLAKLREKLKLFTHARCLIYPKKLEELYPKAWESLPQEVYRLSWGTQATANVRYKLLEERSQGVLLSVCYQDYGFRLFLPFIDEASIENALSAVAFMLYMGYSPQVIEARVQRLRPLSMRMEMKQGIRHNILIDDSYSNDIESLHVALSVLQQQAQERRKVVILSDMLETGLPHAVLYHRIAEMLESAGVHTFIGVGEGMCLHTSFFSSLPEVHCLPSTQALLNSDLLEQLHHSHILIKGARKFAFEQVVQRLEQHLHRTVLEVNLDKLMHNYHCVRRRLHPATRLMVMVKAFAYGSGIEEVARMLSFLRADYLAVAYTDEGIRLRQQGITLPIMVMNPEPGAFEALVEYRLEPELYNYHVLESFQRLIEARGENNYPVHIKIDTGMRRLGFEQDEWKALAQYLAGQQVLKVCSVFSHLAAADEAGQDAFTRRQLQLFEEACSYFQQALNYPFLRHILNSAGIARFPEAQYDMVRLGIALYGIDPSGTLQEELELAARLSTNIAQVKHIQPGESVGYGRRFVARKAMRIATINIGYADGFRRALSNGKGVVYVHGKAAPVVGNICMDMCMIDISDIPEAKEGDRVVVFENLSQLNELSRRLETIPYEVLTGIGSRVKRIFYTDA